MDGFKIVWPEIDSSVIVEKADQNGEVFDWFCGNLPIEVVQSHGVVSGELLYTLNLPLKTDFPFRYEKLPHSNLVEIPPGSVVTFIGAGKVGMVMIKYGPRLTEPMSYPLFGRVRGPDLDTLLEVGRKVWNAIYNTKQIIRVRFEI